MSPFGVEEMSGNVWEWTRSLWGSDGARPDYGYPYARRDGREDKQAGDTVARVLRGGAFYRKRKFARCAARGRYLPRPRHGGIGFRLVLYQPSEE